MIDFQSSAIVESASHLAHRSPSPGDEGELNCSSGRQPAPIKVGRVSPLTAVVMEVHSVILPKTLGPYALAPLRLGVRNPYSKKRSKLQNEPNFRCKLLSFMKKQRKNFEIYDKPNSSVAQTTHI